MISSKKLIRMAKKWQKMAALGRKRITLQRLHTRLVDEGHFVVYSSDQRRFVIPLVYLESEIMRELLQISEEEFGINSAGPITMPCDSVFFDYVISFIKSGVSKDLERALIMSMAPTDCSSTSYHHQEQIHQQLLLCSC